MILRFKPGSEAEKTVKNLIQYRDKTEEFAKDIIQEATELRPLGFGFSWFFSISYSWDCYNTGFDQSAPDEIPGMKFLREKNGVKYFAPNRRTKTGKAISNRFHTEQTELRTDSEPMTQFGIYTQDKESLAYTNWAVGEDEKGIWMAISTAAYEWLEPHPDVMLETKMQTTTNQQS